MLSGIRRLSKSGSKKDATDERLTFSITRADGTFGVGLSDSNYITSIEEGTPAASRFIRPDARRPDRRRQRRGFRRSTASRVR